MPFLFFSNRSALILVPFMFRDTLFLRMAMYPLDRMFPSNNWAFTPLVDRHLAA